MKALSSAIVCTLFATLAAEDYTYSLYAEYLFLQPNGSNYTYGVEAVALNYNIAEENLSPSWKILEINPDYHSGFEIGGSILLNIPKIKIELNWERMHGEDKASYQAPATSGYLVNQIFDIGPNAEQYKVAKGKSHSQFDEVNLRIGKKLCCFDNFHLNFFGGLAVARIQHTLISEYSNISNPNRRDIKTSSTFSGAGPEIGLDYQYRMYENLFFTGNSTLPLFMGKLQNYTTFLSWSPVLAAVGNPMPNSQSTTVPNRTQLIPGFEQKLGFSYFVDWSPLKATFELGYQCQIYLNAVQTMDMIAQSLPLFAELNPDVGVFALAFNRTLSNFILTGPYAFVGFEF